MIERYTRPQMGRVWPEQNKLDKWLQVELAVCEAWADLGAIPRDAVEAIRRARYDQDAIARYLRQTHHDMTAFLRSLADSLPPEAGRFVHLGLTSSDVMDTALSLQLLEATELLEEDLRQLLAVVERRALEH
ncbi:MAG: lyase family protein, partial [Dehalococcoidia bacterium]